MVEQAVSLARDLASDPDSTGTLVHGDLHYANVLLSEAGDWLAIDPKPLSGDPHYEVAPMLWNRFGELAGDVRGGVRRRFHTLVDGAGLDEDRARDWVVVRMLLAALDALTDRDAGYPEDWLTTCIAVAKAVQG
jgi:streptomycin 6-kinase